MRRLREVSSFDAFAWVGVPVESIMYELSEEHLVFALRLGILREVADACRFGEFGSKVRGAFLLLARMFHCLLRGLFHVMLQYN